MSTAIYREGDSVAFTRPDRDSAGIRPTGGAVPVDMHPGETATVDQRESTTEDDSVVHVRMTSGNHKGVRVMAWIDRIEHAPSPKPDPEPEREFVEVSTWFDLSVGDVVTQVHPDGAGPIMVSRAKPEQPRNEVPTILGSVVEANGTVLFLRHADAPTGQVWVNRWDDPWRLESIQSAEPFRVIHDAGA